MESKTRRLDGFEVLGSVLIFLAGERKIEPLGLREVAEGAFWNGSRAVAVGSLHALLGV
jgi:hypothetical protein